MGEGPGGLEGRGCRRYRQTLKWRKERAASGCARPAACLGCRTLTVHGASNGPEVGSRAGPTWGASSFCNAGSGSRLWGSEPSRAVPCYPTPRRCRKPLGRAPEPPALGLRPGVVRGPRLSAQTRSPREAGSAGVVHCGRLAIFMSL